MAGASLTEKNKDGNTHIHVAIDGDFNRMTSELPEPQQESCVDQISEQRKGAFFPTHVDKIIPMLLLKDADKDTPP